MKKLLLLVDKIGPRKKSFADGIANKFPEDCHVYLSEFADLIVKIDGKNIDISVGKGKTKITEFDLVYFRRAGNRFFSLAGTVAICLEYLKIPYFDTTFSQVGPDEDKLVNITRLSLGGFPTIPTYFCNHDKIQANSNDIINLLGLPLVSKDLGSHRGKGIRLIKAEEDFDLLQKDFPKGNFMFQKYIESKEEYRILVLKDTIGAFEKKIPQSGEWRSNVALGAKEEFYGVNTIPENFKKIAVEAAKTLKIQIAGVDILIDKEDKPWLMEVNRGPGITYDDPASNEIDNLAAFFAKELKETK